MICNICADEKTITEMAKCPNCNYDCCKKCMKTYIDSKFKDVVDCMNCHIAFTRQTLVLLLGITYVTKEYQKIQSKIRIDRQRSLLSTFQEKAKNEILRDKEMLELHELEKLIYEKKIIIKNLNEISRFPNSEKKVYIRPCSVSTCKGFLNTNFTCELCNVKTCKDCFETITTEEHVCDENLKANATLLKKDTKNCPKCGTGIYKIDGCFGENTEIPLWNGTIKKVQDIKIGDILIGDDGTPRNVLNTFNGEDNL